MMMNRGRQAMKKFFAQEAGAVAIIFAFCLPMLVTAAGVGLDLAQAYLVRQRLGNALDASALAGATAGSNEADIQQRAQTFFNANYPPEKIGVSYNLTAVLSDDRVTVSADAVFYTTFMSIFGTDSLNIHKEVTVQRDVRGLEVVMVLDNTGSMATNNNIAAVRTASTNFINILFDATDDPEYVKIGMVPYSSSVRVGRYGLGLKPDGSAYADGSSFVTLPSGVSYTTNHSSSTGWYGCVEDHHAVNYNAAATHVAGSYGQLWSTSGGACTYTSAGVNNCRGHGWDPHASDNDAYPDDIPDSYAGPWDIYMYGTRSSSTSNTPSGCGGGHGHPACTGTITTYSFSKASQPNTNCPYAYIMPLSSDRDALLTNVATMQAHGSTLSNTGMAWGYRLMSPDAPFTEGAAWDNKDWRKAVIIMTDGETSMGGNLTTYWFTSQNNIDNTTLDQRMGQICDDLKEKGVKIYTVTFALDIPEATKAAYKACATSEADYFDAPSQSDLIATFENIANQLANLHLSH